MELNSDTFNRLSLGIMEQYQCSAEEALKKLNELKINFKCGDKIRDSLPLQAALLTAVNTASRSFLGGVHIQMPESVETLVEWENKNTLNEIVETLNGKIVSSLDDSFTIHFGLEASIENNCIQVICNNWQAGILVNNEICPFDQKGEMGTAGVFAGSYGVFLAFLKESGIKISACDKTSGISLWAPEMNWLEQDAMGPVVKLIPSKYWILGLGHLGQAYVWTIGFLPYNGFNEKRILYLQDNDRVIEANLGAGLLCTRDDIKKYKTRVCSRWLENRNFDTRIIETTFDANTKRKEEDPYIALCGFDSAKSRTLLENAGFDLIVEAGVGGDLATFDNISFHTFPDSNKTPLQIWNDVDSDRPYINQVILDILNKENKQPCGVIPLDISGKSISTSFIGGCAAALVIAETIRGLNGGKRLDTVGIKLRALETIATVQHLNAYTIELSRNGFEEILSVK